MSLTVGIPIQDGRPQIGRSKMSIPISADSRWPLPYGQIQDGHLQNGCFHPKMATPIWIFSRWRFPYGGFKMTVCSMMMSQIPYDIIKTHAATPTVPLAPEPSLVNGQYGFLCRRTDGAHWRKVEKYIKHRLTCTQINLDGLFGDLEQRVRHAQTRRQLSFRLNYSFQLTTIAGVREMFSKKAAEQLTDLHQLQDQLWKMAGLDVIEFFFQASSWRGL